jgi:hypothetical protein
MRLETHYPTQIIGNITSGSDTITSVDTSANGLFHVLIGIFPKFVDSPYFPPFTRILSYDSGTKVMVLSHPASATKNDVDIMDCPTVREMTALNDPITGGFDSLAWRQGDIIYNSGELPANDNILRWECIKSGMLGADQGGPLSTRASQWRTVQKVPDLVRLVDDADFTVQPADNAIILKNATSGRNMTMLAAATYPGKSLEIVNAGAFSISSSVNLRVTASTTTILINTNTTVKVNSDGVDWWIIGVYPR